MHKSMYNPIIWIDADSPASVIRSYSIAFEALGIDYPSHILDEQRKSPGFTSFNTDWIMKAVQHWLEMRTDADCPWLVILDNADHLAWIADVIPRGPQGSLLITSRDQQVSHFAAQTLYVGDLNSDEAIELLTSGLGPISPAQSNYSSVSAPKTDPMGYEGMRHDAFAIVQQLGHAALTVNMANAYISQHDLLRENLTLYLDALSQGAFSILANYERPPDDLYRFHLATVFETSYMAVNESSTESAWLFALLGHLHSANIEDRLFQEASSTLAAVSRFYATYNPFLMFLKLSCLFLGPYYSVQLLVWLLRNHRPNLTGRVKLYCMRVMTFLPLILDILFLLVKYILEHQRVHSGDVVRRNGQVGTEATLLALYLATVYSLPIVSEFLFGDENPWTLRVLPVLYSTTILTYWLFQWWYYGLDVVVEQHTKVLLDRLNLSQLDMFQFEAMLAGLDKTSRHYLAFMAPIDFTWSLFWNILLHILMVGALIATQILWIVAIEALVSKLQRDHDRPQRRMRILIGVLKILGSRIGTTVMAHGVAFGVGYWIGSTGVGDWIPWEEIYHEDHWSTALLNGFLNQSATTQTWEPVAFAEGVAPITQFGLLQRSQDHSYIMHPLVQWWTQQRLSADDRKRFVRSAHRLVHLAYQSEGCWDNVACQQMLVPHIIAVATADVLNDGTGYWRLKRLLRMLYRSLKLLRRL
jgi:hypothetical protein